MSHIRRRPWWRLSLFVFVMLLLEYLDEFAYSILETARPLIRDTFSLTYIEISLITTIPILIAIVIEPAIGLLFDERKRRLLMVAGCAAFGVGLIIQGVAPTFLLFLVGASLQAPASGVFVNLAQASLMDHDPSRRENGMALWTFSGSLAVVTGPLMLSAALLLGSGWRTVFVVIGILAVLIALWIMRLPTNSVPQATEDKDADEEEEAAMPLSQNVAILKSLLRRGPVWRWLILLMMGDLMLDVLFGLLALYMVDVVGVSQAQAGLAIAIWTGVGLIGDFLLIPLLERVRGLAYLRISAFIMIFLYPLFLLAGPLWLKLGLLGLVGLLNAGWYAILQGKLYDELGENSGLILVVGNVTGVIDSFFPLVLGIIAQRFGLSVAMWVLMISPLTLWLSLINRKINNE